jgi:hypothetical protein
VSQIAARRDHVSWWGWISKPFFAELHYADTPEAAATIAGYLKGLERKRPAHRRKTEPSQRVPTNADASENDPVMRTLKRLFGGTNP